MSKKAVILYVFGGERMMKRFTDYWKQLPGEEKANTLTHIVPLIATFVFAWPLIALASRLQKTAPRFQVPGSVLFIAGMIVMYGSSTLYHAVSEQRCKARLRIADHIAIYVMIAGSYSLICISVVGGWMGWSLFIFLWACVIAGTIGKFIALGKHPRLSLALYLAMGWVALLILYPMWQSIPHAAFFWIIAEGVFYTTGSYFFKKDEKHDYYHAIWHVFIVLGSLSHSIATWLILRAGM